MYLVFTRMPGESYRRRLMSLLVYLCYVFWALINSLVCWFDRKWEHYSFQPKENFPDFLPFVRTCWHFCPLNAGNHFCMNLSANYGIFALKILLHKCSPICREEFISPYQQIEMINTLPYFTKASGRYLQSSTRKAHVDSQPGFTFRALYAALRPQPRIASNIPSFLFLWVYMLTEL